ncbi:hypothetical protein BGX27_003467 [Mortierella sp. AM989]|nr:hypothetical protein BGX27_003467 [Mortierella sp. AM989]
MNTTQSLPSGQLETMLESSPVYQWSATAERLPLELLALIAGRLSKTDLSACVQVCKDWYNLFIPSLWETVKISHVNYSRFIASVEEGSLARNGSFIKHFETRYYSIVQLLESHSDTCNNLVTLQIHAYFKAVPVPSFTAIPASDSLEGTRVSSSKTPLPRQKPMDLAILTRLVRKNTKLQKLELYGSLFYYQEARSISRLVQAIPPTVETLAIPGMESCRSNYESTVATAKLEDDKDYDLKEMIQLNVKRIKLQGGLPDAETLVYLLKRCPHIDTLIYTRTRGDGNRELCLLLREHCPKLRQLHVKRNHGSDRDLSYLFDASSKGWISVDVATDVFGPLSAAALLKHASSLEVFRGSDCPYGFNSSNIQRLLCTAPNLKHLDVLDALGRFDVKLDAQDIVQSRWICDKLEVLKIKITGIPRPDILIRTNSRPLTGPLHEGHAEDSILIQRMVYSQLGAMTRLKELFLGSDVADHPEDHDLYWEEELSMGEYFDPKNLQSWRQYECLSFTLDSGMDRLCHLKSLEKIQIPGMCVGFDGAAEQEWVKDNWPALKYAYGDWNYIGEYRGYEP